MYLGSRGFCGQLLVMCVDLYIISTVATSLFKYGQYKWSSSMAVVNQNDPWPMGCSS